MDLLGTPLNVAVGAFVISTMLAAGMSVPLADVGRVVRDGQLLLRTLTVNLVIVPLAAWGGSVLMGLSTGAAVALIMMGASPGGPFGARLAMVQRGDVATGAALQVILALVGSVSLPLLGTAILAASGHGQTVQVSVGQLLGTVMALMLLPFAVGLLASQRWPGSAHRAGGVARQVSALAFVAVVVMLVWVAAVDPRGSLDVELIAASVLLTVVALAAGTLLSTGTSVTRTTVGVLAPSGAVDPSWLRSPSASLATP